MIPSYKRAGDPVLATDFNDLARAMHSLFSVRGVNGVGVNVSSEGLLISDATRQILITEPAQVAQAKNVDDINNLNAWDVAAITIPWQVQGGIDDPGQPITDLDSVRMERVLEIYRPTDHCFGRFCICAEDIDVGDIGRVWIAGVCLTNIALDPETFSRSLGIQKPDRADTVKDAIYLKAGYIGAAQILWRYVNPIAGVVFGQQPAIIKFDHRQTTAVGFHEIGNDQNQGLAEVIQLDASVVVTPVAPGIIEIDKAP